MKKWVLNILTIILAFSDTRSKTNTFLCVLSRGFQRGQGGSAGEALLVPAAAQAAVFTAVSLHFRDAERAIQHLFNQDFGWHQLVPVA